MASPAYWGQGGSTRTLIMGKQANRYEIPVNELKALKASAFWGDLSCHAKMKVSTALKLFEEVLEEIKEKEK